MGKKRPREVRAEHTPSLIQLIARVPRYGFLFAAGLGDAAGIFALALAAFALALALAAFALAFTADAFALLAAAF